jgi:hypothetical protein
MPLADRVAVAALLSLSSWLCPPAPLSAQEGPVKGNLGITVSAVPARLTAGDSVRLAGSTGLTGSSSQVTIVVRPPGKPAVTLKTKPGSKGDYQAKFGATGAPGTYQVEATAPDGKGKATTSFTIVAPGVLVEQAGRKADSLVLLSSQVVDRVQQAVAAMPASPAKNEAKEKLDQVDTELARLPQQVAVFRQQMAKVFAARAKIAKPIPEWVDYEAELEDWEADADLALAKLEKLAKPTAAATQGCSDLDRYNEMLTFTSEVMNYLKAPFDFTRGFWTDKIPGGLVARASGAGALTSAERFALVETMKIGAAALEGPAGIVSAIPGLLLDTAQWFVQDYFGQFCEKWEGPIQGVFLGESFTRQGEPFFDYTVTLDGKLMLLYPKNVPAGKPVALQGYLEGNGQFEIRDNPKPIARLVPGAVLFHRITAPPGGRYWDELGQASRGVLPHSFRIPVKGIMAGDSIMLTVLPADHDFGPTVTGVSTWVIMPLGGMLPEVINAKIGLQKAHPIIERVVRRRPILRIVTAGKTMTAEATFSRDTTNVEKTARVRTTLKVKTCNPGCLPLPGAGKE